MDGERLDILSKQLSSAPPRRALLRAVAGLAAGVLVLPWRDGAATACKTTCGVCRRCRKGRCRPKRNGAPCPTGACWKGKCEAPCVVDCTGKECGENGCGGSCGACAGGEVCRSSRCCRPNRGICETGDQCCSGVCDLVASKGAFGCGVGSVTKCCVFLRDPGCSGDCDCCGSGVCRDGRCCLPTGTPCVDSNDCCASCDFGTFTCR